MSHADLRGTFIWHELMTSDATAAAEFYARVLSWTHMASTVPGYTLCKSGAWDVAGVMSQSDASREQSTPPTWLVYVAAPDVDATATSAQKLGGKLLKAPTEIPGMGRFAVLSDPQGAAFAVFAPVLPLPEDAQAGLPGQFSWHELATIDPHGALAFYAQLFGWTVGVVHEMSSGGRYQVIEHAGMPIGGMYLIQDPSKPPHWLSYVHVNSLEQALAAVSAHGGRILHGPHVVPGGDRVAQIVDPQGGALALHERAKAAPVEPMPTPLPRKAPARKAPARKAPARKAPARKAPARKAPARKAPARKAPARKAPARKAPARKAPTRKAPARKTPARKAPARQVVHSAPSRKRTAGPRRDVNRGQRRAVRRR